MSILLQKKNHLLKLGTVKYFAKLGLQFWMVVWHTHFAKLNFWYGSYTNLFQSQKQKAKQCAAQWDVLGATLKNRSTQDPNTMLQLLKAFAFDF